MLLQVVELLLYGYASLARDGCLVGVPDDRTLARQVCHHVCSGVVEEVYEYVRAVLHLNSHLRRVSRPDVTHVRTEGVAYDGGAVPDEHEVTEVDKPSGLGVSDGVGAYVIDEYPVLSQQFLWEVMEYERLGRPPSSDAEVQPFQE